MNKYGYHSSNIRPVSSAYQHDSDVSITDTTVGLREGLDIIHVSGLSGIEDVTSNNFNYLFLTNKVPVNNVLKLDKKVDTYPYYIVSWLKAADEDKFLVVDGNTGSTTMSGTSATVASNYIFEFEFLSPIEVAVRHYHRGNLRFLTLNQVNSSELNFGLRSIPAGGAQDTQSFKYILDDDVITLVHNLSTIPSPGIPSIRYPYVVTAMTNLTGGLSAVSVPTNTQPFSGANQINKFRIRRSMVPSPTFSLNDTYVKYVSSINTNNLIIDDANKITANNNFIIHTATNELNVSSKQMDINLFPMKNQLTLESGTSRNNPYNSVEDEVSHRTYHKLHTGTSQKYGNDSIYTTFTTGTKELILPSDQLTYFHLPQNLTPYVSININDSTLIKSGAIAGGDPSNSDKMFKKREDVFKYNIPKDELNGTFLCSWLSGNGNPHTTPVWVDRYFNPSYATKIVALTAGLLEPVPYIDTYESVTRHVGASGQRITVYDKLSDLLLEPGILYAYHHVGRGNSQKIIYALRGSILSQDFEIFKDFRNINLLPDFATEELVHIDSEGNVATGETFNSRAIEVPLEYKFNRDNYGITNIIKNTGSFTVNFWLWAKDWGKPFCNQLLGNYITKGFGIFNEQYVTPFITIPSENKVHIYNSDAKYLTTHFIQRDISLFTKRGCSENYWIVDSNNDIFEYNINGVIQDKITSTHLQGREPVDIELSTRYLYVLFRPNSGQDADYFRYDYTRRAESGYKGEVLSAPIWNYRSGTGATLTNNLSTCKIHVVNTGLSASNGILITQQDVLSSVNTSYNLLSGAHMFANGSVIDNDGKPWVLQNGSIYTFQGTTSANIQAISATSLIEGVSIDKKNNVWVLHDFNKVSKLDNDRTLLFTSTLSSILPLSAARYNRSIDYISEFGTNGYDQYPIVVTQSVSGSTLYKLNSDTGRVTSEVALLTGENLNLQTFLTSPSAYKTYTGDDFLRKTSLSNVPRLVAKASLTDIYNTSTTTQTYSTYTVHHDLSGLDRGWHNFCVVLNAEQGHYSLYIDSFKVDTISLSGAKYSWSDIFESRLVAGTSPFYTKLILSEHLQQPRHYLANDIKMKNVKVYNRPLNYFEIRDHYQVLQDTFNVKWDIPIGQRNYIDTVERMFKHSLPGRKSEFVNINIKNTNITDPELINDIKAKVTERLADNLPIYCKINELGWDSTFTTLTGVPERKVTAFSMPQNKPQSTTSILTGDLIINER